MRQPSKWAAAFAAPLFALLVATVTLTSGATESWAYEQYSQAGDATNCGACHGDFRGANYISNKDGTAWGLDLHDGHRVTMLDRDCNTCHGPSRFPVVLNSSNGGTGLDPIACVGCHGRAADAGPASGSGAGLRQHHWNSGVAICAACHADADPANYTTVAENTPPPYYFTPDPAHPNKPTNACDDPAGTEAIFGPTGLDNDGNLFEDGADASCVVNQPPTADPNGPYNGTVDVAVQFDGSASIDPDGTIVAYDWDFGDGGSLGTGVDPTHTYTVDGIFTVTLTVTDDEGLTGVDVTTATIGLGNLPPVADPNGPYSGTVGQLVQFDGTGSTDPDGTVVAYDWDFGDGNFGIGPAATHTYAAAGVFNVTLTVTDDGGLTNSAGTTAAIAPVPNVPPVADPDGPYPGTVGVAVQFEGSGSFDNDGTIVAYDWDFGDGSPLGTGVNPTHTYTVGGTFIVTLTVTDDAGDTGMASTSATISVPNQPPVADPNGPYSGTVGQPVQFNGLASNDPDGTIVAYDWEFGDGGAGTGVNPAHTYAVGGSFTVTLTVTDNAGAIDSASTTATISVGNQPPTADPNGPYTGTVGVAVEFDGSASNDPDGTIVAYDWEFGDGTVDLNAGPTPTHSYAADATFNVTLTVTDDAGAPASAATTATISAVAVLNLDPVALRVTKRVSLTRVKPIVLKLVVKNNGTVEGSALATILGEQNGVEVYNETLIVTDAVGKGRAKFDDGSVPPIPTFTPTAAGDIVWTAIIDDEDGSDLDEIMAVTRVVP